MKLPKRDLPEFSLTLPYSKLEIKYRPYTVKEERILSMAAQADDSDSVNDAIKQIIENCSTARYEQLTDADFEFLFLKLISTSVSNVSQVSINNDCGKDNCPKVHSTAVNLDEVKVIGIDSMKDSGFLERKSHWVVPFDDVSGICMRPILSTGDTMETIFKSTVNVYDEDGVYDEFTKEELTDYIESLSSKEFDMIQKFIDSQPYCSIDVCAKCYVCKKDNRVSLKGVLDFLE